MDPHGSNPPAADARQHRVGIVVAAESAAQVAFAGGGRLEGSVRAPRSGMLEVVAQRFLPKNCRVLLTATGAGPDAGPGAELGGVVRKVQLVGAEPSFALTVQVDAGDAAALVERRADGLRTRELPRRGAEMPVPGAGAVPGWAALLVREGLIAELELRRVALGAKTQGAALEAALGEVIAPQALALCMALDSSVPFVEPSDYTIHPGNAALLPEDFARRSGVFALFDVGGGITLGMADPTDLALIDQVRLRTKRQVDPVLCPAESLSALIERSYAQRRRSTPPAAPAGRGGPGARATSAPNAVQRRLAEFMDAALEAGASDVHIEPELDFARVRIRVDGLLHETTTYPAAEHTGLVSSIKVRAQLDIAETRRPQDGNFREVRGPAAVDVRVSTIPTVHGENVVLRLLRSDTELAGIDELGLPDAVRAGLGRALQAPNGLLLVTGPTGSGKTSTLYASLAHLNSVQRNIVTIEDPVERQLPMLRQTQVNAKAGLTFAGGLRSILRQDPDVIMVGEIRDRETAEIAVQAALTGHLVLSTLHTNSAADTLVRLAEMGVPPFLITSSLRGVIGQRLARRVCAHCARDVEPDLKLLSGLGWSEPAPESVREGAGCATCLGTGYRGRVGLYELLEPTAELAEALVSGARRDTLESLSSGAIDRGLRACGLDRVRDGSTTLAEVARVAGLVPVRQRDPQ